MSDRTAVQAALAAAEDAFDHATGPPTFEPEIDSSADVTPATVHIQKACRLLTAIEVLQQAGAFFGAIVEQSFIAIEHSLSGYLLEVTNIDERVLRNHQTPYHLAEGQVPLEDESIRTIRYLFDERRSSHYYDTAVSTAAQAEAMAMLADKIHAYLVSVDHSLKRACRC